MRANGVSYAPAPGPGGHVWPWHLSGKPYGTQFEESPLPTHGGADT